MHTSDPVHTKKKKNQLTDGESQNTGYFWEVDIICRSKKETWGMLEVFSHKMAR